jgi:carbonic anhydrase
VSAIDLLLAGNETFAGSFDRGYVPPPPELGLVVITCMDARIDVYAALGLELAQAHVLRNAGGVVTDDTIRSLAISQRLLGTREVAVIHHTDCGMLNVDEADFKDAVERETGIRPEWSLEAFADLDGDVRESLARIEASPFVPHRDAVRGFVYDVATGRLREVSPVA